MTNRLNGNFSKGVERLVNPVDVGTLHFIQNFNNYVPKKIQKKMVASSGQITPQMGFVVEPYSYFLCYEIEDLEQAKSLLPKNFKLAKTKVFEEDEPNYYALMGCFNAHTSGFWGLRVEFYMIAEDVNTGLLSWVIVDYDTNTITYDPKNGLSDPNATGSIMTIDYDGIIYTDVKNVNGRKLIFNSDIKAGLMKPLDQRLWIEGNLSVAYGGVKVEDDPGVFSLTFDPKEYEKALEIPLDHIHIEENNWYPGLFKAQPSKLVCFPYAQHILSDSPGHASRYMDEKDLIQAVEGADFESLKVFSTDAFKKAFMIGGIVSFTINALLLTLLILK